jgi:hypothetical protein
LTGRRFFRCPPPTADGDGGARARVIGAFATVYVVWGSTYLAIRAQSRHAAVPHGGSRSRFGRDSVRGRASARSVDPRSQWRTAAITGFLLICIERVGAWAERRVPSGLAALLVAVVRYGWFC